MSGGLLIRWPKDSPQQHRERTSNRSSDQRPCGRGRRELPKRNDQERRYANLKRRLHVRPPKQKPLRHLVLLLVTTKCEAELQTNCPTGSNSPQALVALGDDDRSTVVLGNYDVGTRRTRLGKLLIEQGLISQDQLADALMAQSETGEKLGAILLRLGHVQEESIAGTLSRQLQIPLIRVEQEEIDENVARSVERETAERTLAIPMRRSQYGVLVAMADPLDMESINLLESHFGESVDPLVAIESEILRVIERVYSVDSA